MVANGIWRKIREQKQQVAIVLLNTVPSLGMFLHDFWTWRLWFLYSELSLGIFLLCPCLPSSSTLPHGFVCGHFLPHVGLVIHTLLGKEFLFNSILYLEYSPFGFEFVSASFI